MLRIRMLRGGLFGLLLSAASVQAEPGDSERGQLLYENHCVTCHESVIHIRAHRLVRTPKDVERQVRRWAEEIGMGWSEREIADVVRYVQDTFYQTEKP